MLRHLALDPGVQELSLEPVVVETIFPINECEINKEPGKKDVGFDTESQDVLQNILESLKPDIKL